MSDILEILEKPGCHLCEDALPPVEKLARRLKLPIHRVDVEQDDDLLVEFALRIPVVRLRGTVLAEGVVEYKPMLSRAREVLQSRR